MKSKTYTEPEIVIEEEMLITAPRKTKMQKIKRFFTKKRILTIIFILLAIGFAYYFIQYKKLTKDPKVAAKEKTAEVIKQISALAVVPNDPNAVLANVTDISKLKDQPFFKDAQNGDEIVIFPSAMRAVLYRPSINKIINIGPLSSSQATDATTVKTVTSKTETTAVPKTTTATKPTAPVKKP